MENDDLDKGRTVVVSGVPDALPLSRMVDKLTIHFQTRRRSRGGDVEAVRYPTNLDGVAFVIFDEAKDAARVTRNERQIMVDDEFPEEYLLTVYPFTRDVFFYVSSATVNLSVFGRDQASLIQRLRSAHRSLRFRPLPGESITAIEGPFTAIQALRQDLIRRASRVKSRVPAQTAAKLKEAPLNPRVISHRESVSPVSCGGSKAKLEPASSNSLSTPPQTTGEATEVLLSNAKTQNGYSRRNISSPVRSFCNPDSYEEQQRARSRHRVLTEYRTESAKANPRQVVGEEISAGIRSSLSGPDLLPAEDISMKQQREDGISQKRTRPDRASTPKIRGENHLGSGYSRTDYLKESDQSSSAVTAKPPRTRLKDVSKSSNSGSKGTEALSAVCPQNQEDMCIWVDSYTFRYIQKFDKDNLDMCLSGLEVSAKCVEGTDLMQIMFTAKQTSQTSSRIQQASQDLCALVDSTQSTLRVYQVNLNKKVLSDKQKLNDICKNSNTLYDDVLYMFEDSCIKVIGPSISSFLFCRTVEDRVAKLKDRSLTV
ncbi:uncharacterized protein LOC119014999 isoform X2 [Acanthopagrus latus]|uniref:uncharacterized protein LOC119014999 isoform X2 n=1 Tax=Acanthopagrus latus TaxID=8177 RepID=UPI00187C58E0|nr:uncharacterized protein LOC119014999 isoform X2 [Acanthopagrus latus]